MTTRIPLEVSFEGRDCCSVPMSMEIDFGEYVKGSGREEFNSSWVRMVDKTTGKNIPCEFSTVNTERLVGTLSWILLSHAQKEMEIVVERKRLRSHHPSKGVEMWNRGDDQLEISTNGKHITSYIYNDAYERPFLYPVIGPDDLPVTRCIPNFGDHPLHKGISLALGDVSRERGKPGINLWGLGNIGDPKQGRVIHQRFTNLEHGPIFAKIQEENIWKQNDEFLDFSCTMCQFFHMLIHFFHQGLFLIIIACAS